MTEKEDSTIKEVFIVKRKSKIDSEDYVSVQLRSSNDSIEELLQKAMDASTMELSKEGKKTAGVQ